MRYFRIVSLSSICLLVLTGLIFTNYSVASPLITTTPSHTPIRDQHNYLPLVLKDAADVMATVTATATSIMPTATATATNVTPTTTTTSTPTMTPIANTVQLRFQENLEWKGESIQIPSFDLVIVLDQSASMANCWNSNDVCEYPNRKIDKLLPALNSFIYRKLVDEKAINNTSHRVGLVTFGMSNTAKLDINLTKDVNAFTTLLGTATQPKAIPSSQLRDHRSWAQGLDTANLQLQTTSIDENGRPRKKAIIFITDGTANVLFDQPYKGVLNGDYPFHCGYSNNRSIDDPLVQSTCPILSTSSNVRSPVRAAIDVADLARNTNRILTHAILLGSPYSISDMKLDQIAPTFAQKATQPNDVDTIFGNLNAQFQTVQCSVMSETRPAIGANVTIKDASNTILVQGTTDASGIFTATLSPTTYMVSAEHLNIVAPNDSEAISRTYRLAATAFNPINPPAPFLLTRDPDTPLCP